MADGSSAEEQFDFLGTVKILLGISGEEKDTALRVYLSMSERAILNYCNISALPPELNYTLCQMCADTYRDISAANTKGEIAGAVGSISEDGRSVSFTSGAEFRTAVDDRVTRIKELSRFRKLYRTY